MTFKRRLEKILHKACYPFGSGLIFIGVGGLAYSRYTMDFLMALAILVAGFFIVALRYVDENPDQKSVEKVGETPQEPLQ